VAAKLKYDPDEAHRRKHQWDQPRSEFVEQGGAWVGKCSSEIDLQQAQRLLDTGIRYAGRCRGKMRPERVYNVHQGVPYRAHIMGDRYHGFPEMPSEIPPGIREQLRELAVRDGDGEIFDEWMSKYGDL